MSSINVLNDLYSLIEQVAETAEDVGLELHEFEDIMR